MKLRVVLGPNSWDMRVVDDLTGEAVENVVAVYMEARKDCKRVVHIEVLDVEVGAASPEESR